MNLTKIYLTLGVIGFSYCWWSLFEGYFESNMAGFTSLIGILLAFYLIEGVEE